MSVRNGVWHRSGVDDPPEENMYLCCYKARVSGNWCITFGWWDGKRWASQANKTLITHWMPMPKPPKE